MGFVEEVDVTDREKTELDAAVEVVSRRGWFAERSGETRSALTRIARVKHFASGEPLYLFGDRPNGVFGLVRGALDVSIPRSDGMEVTVHQADPGYWVGDSALLAGQTRLVSVIAARPTVTVHLPCQGLWRLLDEKPALIRDFYELSHRNMALALRIMANLATASSDSRVAARLLMHDEDRGDGALSMSQTKLAELLALSTPTLHRVLRRLQDRGLVALGYGEVRIVDREGLRRLLEAPARY